MRSKILMLLVVATATQGCAIFSNIKNGNMSGAGNAALAAGAEAVEVLAEGKRRAEAKEKSILDAPVSFEEERAMGGVVAVNLAANNGGLLLDGMNPNATADALAADVIAKKKVSLPDSAKNDLTAYLSVVGRNLAKYSDRPEISWTFTVVENETPNAFSSPGGYVTVTTGLLNKITNEAQLAGVLGHEIGHVVHKHSIKRYKEGKGKQAFLATFGGYVVSKGLQAAIDQLPADAREASKFVKDFEDFDLDKADGKFVVFVMDAVLKVIESFGNEKADEFQADATALELVAFAGYDAAEYEKFLTSLGAQGGGFSKHPSTDERVAKLKALREGDLAPFATGTAKPDTAKQFAVIKPKS